MSELRYLFDDQRPVRSRIVNLCRERDLDIQCFGTGRIGQSSRCPVVDRIGLQQKAVGRASKIGKSDCCDREPKHGDVVEDSVAENALEDS